MKDSAILIEKHRETVLKKAAAISGKKALLATMLEVPGVSGEDIAALRRKIVLLERQMENMRPSKA